MYGQQYAAQLLLCNAGKTAMKALICSRPELNDWVKFMPDFGFIQVTTQANQRHATMLT